MVVSHSVYRRSVRDFIRSQLPGVVFVVLDVPTEVAGARQVKNLVDTCQQRGQTLSQFFRAFHPEMKDAPEVPEDEIKRQIIAHNTAAASGFEARQDDEPNTIGIPVTADVSREQLAEEVMKRLNAAQ